MSIERGVMALAAEQTAFMQQILPLTTADRYWQPAPDAWSALQVMEHLVLVDELVAAQLPDASVRPNARWGRAAILLMRLASGAGAKVRVPLADIVPRGEANLDQLVHRWHLASEALWTIVRERSRRAEAVLLTHPVAGPLSCVDGLAFLREHIRHHRRQLDRLAELRRWERDLG